MAEEAGAPVCSGTPTQLGPGSEKLRKILWNAGYRNLSERGIMAEHRREQRLPINSRGACTIHGRVERMPVVVKDISLRGIQFESDEPVFVGESCHIIACLPGVAPCRMDVIIRWVAIDASRDKNTWRAGAELVTPPSDEDSPPDAPRRQGS